jgi:hypothetical protein
LLYSEVFCLLKNYKNTFTNSKKCGIIKGERIMNNGEFNHENILKNRAEFANTANKIDCQECFEPLIFAMKDNEHDFTIGLITILQCLEVAENTNVIPKIGCEWWVTTKRICNIR